MYCGKLEQAARSLQWLRGDAVDVEAELANIQTNIETSRHQKVREPGWDAMEVFWLLPRPVSYHYRQPLLFFCIGPRSRCIN